MNTSWQQWTLRHIRGLVEKIEKLEDSVGDLLVENKDYSAQIERMRTFAASTDLQNVDSLLENAPNPAEAPLLLLQKLAPYFEGGLLLQKTSADSSSWSLTAFVTRGEYFQLDPNEQLNADHLVQPLGPDQVLRAGAQSMLAEIPVPFAHISRSAQAFLMMPTPTTAYILISDIPDLWREDHVRRSLRLLNDAFNP